MARVHATSEAALQGSHKPFITCWSKCPFQDSRSQLGMMSKSQSMKSMAMGLPRVRFAAGKGQKRTRLALMQYHLHLY